MLPILTLMRLYGVMLCLMGLIQCANAQFLELNLSKSKFVIENRKFNIVAVEDSRYDTTRVGIIKVGNRKTIVNFRYGLKKELKSYFLENCPFLPGNDSVIVNVIRFNISENEWDKKRVCVLDAKFQTVLVNENKKYQHAEFKSRKLLECKSDGHVFHENNVVTLLQELLTHINENSGKPIDNLTLISEFSKPILKTCPYLKSGRPKKGIYLSFTEFRNNDPLIIDDDFDLVFDSDKKEYYLPKQNGHYFYYDKSRRVIPIHTKVWGYSDGNKMFMLDDDGNRYLLKNNNGVVEYWGLNKKGQPEYYILDVETGESIPF